MTTEIKTTDASGAPLTIIKITLKKGSK